MQHCHGTVWGHGAWGQPPPPWGHRDNGHPRGPRRGSGGEEIPLGGSPICWSPCPSPSQTAGQQKRQERGTSDPSCPAQVLLAWWPCPAVCPGCRRLHVALAPCLSPPGDTPAAESHPRAPRATGAVAAGLYRALCIERLTAPHAHCIPGGPRHNPPGGPGGSYLPTAHGTGLGRGTQHHTLTPAQPDLQQPPPQKKNPRKQSAA